MAKLISLPTCVYTITLNGILKSRNVMCLTLFISKPRVKLNVTQIKLCTCLSSSKLTDYFSFSDGYDEKGKELMLQDMIVLENFLEEHEERSLIDEIEPYIRRLRYEFDHWDNAIHGYRETERKTWKPQNNIILDRVKQIAFPPGTSPLSFVHVLDLAENGVIKPHIDSVRFCGNTIAGLSLLSDSVMRLVNEKDKIKTVDILLKQRSLYIMKGIARYDFTHEILGKEQSKFKGISVSKGRRLSVICRNEPEKS